MEFSLDSYRMLGRQCGAAHRIARDTGNAKAATNLFATLWSRLDRETLDDHCDARAAFNAAFGPAYRSGDNPPCAPAPAPTATAALYDYLHPKIKSERSTPRKSVYAGNKPAADAALACAAFFARKVEA